MKKLSIYELHRLEVSEFKKAKKNKIIIILDNLRSQYNVGSIFRTCDAFRIEELLLCGITATPPNREIEKSALGATLSVNWQYFKNSCDAINYCKTKNFKVIAIEQTNESIPVNLFKYNVDDKYAFVFGNEINGVSEDVLELCDASIEILQYGTKHSFNVAVSVAIILYDYFYKCNLF
ncbi:MAG: RNA methyltransferase [Bacteroidales bacterium]|nr:RNA methyltransferase [Bacteroidales bacterium]